MALGIGAFISIATAVPAADKIPGSIREWEASWTNALSKNVDAAGRVDFAGLARSSGDLDRVIAFVAAVDPVSRPDLFPSRESRLAYYINAYNALAMYGIVQTGVPESLGRLRRFAFFYLRTFSIGGKSISLYDLENDIIRSIGEERIHFALNCMVVSCPRLPRTAFRANTLERQLAAAARLFVSESRNVLADADNRVVGLSSIFKFYTDDFLAHAPSLIGYVNRYRTEQIPSDFKVRFLDYDWTVNDRGRKAGAQ